MSSSSSCIAAASLAPHAYQPLPENDVESSGSPVEQAGGMQQGPPHLHKHAGCAAALATPGGSPSLATLSQKMRAYGHLLREPEYAKSGAAFLSSCAGLGLLNGGYLMMVDAAGHENNSWSVVLMAVSNAVESYVATGSALVACHRRDNEDMGHGHASAEERPRVQFNRGLGRVGGADACAAAVMVGTVLGYRARRINELSLTAVVLALNAGRAAYRGMDWGFWACLKMHLGDARARDHQCRMNRTIGSIEDLIALPLYNAGMLLYFAALARARSDREMATFSAVALTVGGLLASLPRLYFWRAAVRQAATAGH